jgi:oligopeptidase B
MTLSLREGGLPIIEVHPQGLPAYRVQLPDAAYSLYVQNTLEFDSDRIRLRYEALNRPATGAPTVWRPASRSCSRKPRFSARSTPMPMSASACGRLRPTARRCRSAWWSSANWLGKPVPLYLYGYGAYGESLDPWFSHARLSLLDRGMAFAIAHVRGGGELGEAWYRAGKQEHKQNTFSDFIACAEHLIAQPHQRRTTGDQRRQCWRLADRRRAEPAARAVSSAAIAEVPFVDVLNTMLDPDLPLTVTEYDEWGNPEEPDVYARIKAYAPYENVSAQAYPAMLVIAGYNDSRVQYWEAAKWVAKLRTPKPTPICCCSRLNSAPGTAA